MKVQHVVPRPSKTRARGKAKTLPVQPTPDMLTLCKTVMLESLDILRKVDILLLESCRCALTVQDGFASDSERGSFTDWLQCYMKLDQTTDSLGRTMWLEAMSSC